jgi:hypothetical protein
VHVYRRFVRASVFVLASVVAVSAQVATSTEQTPAVKTAEAAPSWEEILLNLPVVRYFTSLLDWLSAAPSADAPGAQTTAALPNEPVAGCSVAPLDPIVDPAAQALEASSASQSAVDVADMVPAAARALNRFESKVGSAGGTIVLKSAYRPEAYQRHLQNVWYKWMDELKGNRDPACQGLRAQVQEEFTRHHLIETQHPVAVSDHTRGLAFDATVDLPQHARIGRRRITLDGLARLAGLVRPAIVADPVHFKYLGAFRITRRS